MLGMMASMAPAKTAKARKPRRLPASENRRIRRLEGMVWQLDDELGRLQEILRACRAEVKQIRERFDKIDKAVPAWAKDPHGNPLPVYSTKMP
jgi:predicted RNase H-like nuclease (RuvC/YqgF family)